MQLKPDAREVAPNTNQLGRRHLISTRPTKARPGASWAKSHWA